MRKPLVAGNWKLNGSKSFTDELIAGLKAGIDQVSNADVAICPPFPYLAQAVVGVAGSVIAVGSQDVADQESGAFTGEVAAPMLKDIGCRYAIVGHSERRSLYAEDDAFTARKFAAARAAGLTPILCVGETLEEREQGITEQVVARQIQAVLDKEGIAAFGEAVIAYEPVWAIGTGMTATPEQAQQVHAYIRGLLAAQDSAIAEKVQILYGGSMKPDNAAELIAQADIDGGLIGGASLKAEDFLAICKAA